MSIPWILALGAAFPVIDCGSSDSEDCPAGSKSQTVCVACGPAGGCGQTEKKCARTCAASGNDCADLNLSCFEGVCQVSACF